MPLATWTWNLVESGSFADGVMISLDPCQKKVWGTEGVMEKAASAVSCLTGLLSSTSMEARVIARPLLDVLLIRIANVGGIRSTMMALYRTPDKSVNATSADRSLRKRPLLSRLSRLGRSTGQDDNTAPILAILMNRKTLGCLFELLETVLLTLVIFMVIQAFVAQPYQVQQPSMENTLMPDQYVLVDKLTPHFDDFHRGDIVVFAPPASSNSEPTSAPFIKRVIGVAGDTIDIHAGHVFVNGLELSEPYIYPGQLTEPSSPSKHVWTLTVGQLFVMGD